MLVLCDACGKALNIPDEKVPAGRRFAFSCPACQHKIKVDPEGNSGGNGNEESSFSFADGEPGGAAPTSEPASTAAAPAEPSDAAASRGPTLPSLRPAERELLLRLPPTALVVDHEIAADPTVQGDLETLGFHEIRSVDLAAAAELAAESEIGMIVVRVPKASAPPFEPLTPVVRLAPEVRRRTFVALVAENVQSLDGQVAFLLQVNCLLAHRDRPRHLEMLRRALLHDLKLYQHWDAAEA